MRILKVLFAMVLMGAFCVPSYGAVVDTLTPNKLNGLEDEDLEVTIDKNGTPLKVDSGDLLLAIATFTTKKFYNGTIDTGFNASLSAGGTTTYTKDTLAFTVVSLIAVDTVTGSGGSVDYTFKAPTVADWAAVHPSLGDVTAGTMVVFFDDPISTPAEHIFPGLTVAAGLASAMEGTRLWEMGFDGSPGEFWTAFAVDNVAPKDASDITQITNLDFFAAINVLKYNAGSGLSKHNALGDPDLNGAFAPLFTAPTDLQLQGNKDTGTATPWAIHTDTDVYIFTNSAVPEPATICMFAMIGGAFALRRRQKMAGR